jgi:NADPH:quinone reductase-like Zn-dependent oxidoreductase
VVSMLEQPRKELMEKFGVEAVFQFTQITTDRLTKLAELVDAGALKVHVDKILPLRQAASAMLTLEKEPPRGKVVLRIA